MSKFYNISCLNVENSPINKISLKSFSDILDCALCRQDGSIEYWNYLHNNDYWIQTFLYPGKKDLFWSCLLILSPRIVLLGNNSSDLCLFDFRRTLKVSYFNSFGDGVWSMTLKNNLIIVGCNDGTITVFDYDTSTITLQFVKILYKFPNRVLSISCNAKNEIIACSTDNALIHLIDYAKNVPILKINGDTIFGIKALLWSVILTNDGNLFVGDSFGKVQLYETKFGQLIQSFNTHEAPILTMVYDEEKNILFASGIDSKISLLRKNKNDWFISEEIRNHHNDVTCLFLLENHLISASVDGSMNHYRINNFSINFLMNFGIFPQENLINVAIKKDCIILHGKLNKLSLYKIDDGITKLLTLNIKDNLYVKSCGISLSGDYLVYSTLDKASCLKVSNFDSFKLSKHAFSNDIKIFDSCINGNMSEVIYTFTFDGVFVQELDFGKNKINFHQLDIDIDFIYSKMFLSWSDRILGIIFTDSNLESKVYLYDVIDFHLICIIESVTMITCATMAYCETMVIVATVEDLLVRYDIGNPKIIKDVLKINNKTKNMFLKGESFVRDIFIENEHVVLVRNNGIERIKSFSKEINKENKITFVNKSPLILFKRVNNGCYININRSFSQILETQKPSLKRKRFGIS